MALHYPPEIGDAHPKGTWVCAVKSMIDCAPKLIHNKTIKDGDIAPWKDLQKKLNKDKEKNKETTIF